MSSDQGRPRRRDSGEASGYPSASQGNTNYSTTEPPALYSGSSTTTASYPPTSPPYAQPPDGSSNFPSIHASSASIPSSSQGNYSSSNCPLTRHYASPQSDSVRLPPLNDIFGFLQAPSDSAAVERDRAPYSRDYPPQPTYRLPHEYPPGFDGVNTSSPSGNAQGWTSHASSSQVQARPPSRDPYERGRGRSNSPDGRRAADYAQQARRRTPPIQPQASPSANPPTTGGRAHDSGVGTSAAARHQQPGETTTPLVQTQAGSSSDQLSGNRARGALAHGRYKCLACETPFDFSSVSAGALRKHMSQKHYQSSHCRIDGCLQSFDPERKQDWDDHRRIEHEAGILLVCPTCGFRTYEGRTDLQAHRRWNQH